MRDMKVKLLGSIPHSSSEEKEAFRRYAEDLKVSTGRDAVLAALIRFSVWGGADRVP